MSWISDQLTKVLPGLSGADKVAAEAAIFGQAVTDGKMWRSLGWLLLGIVLLYLAFRMLTQ